MLHNETMNVWSHLLGAIAFICTFIYVLVYLQAVPETTYQIGREGFAALQCDNTLAADFDPTKKQNYCPYAPAELLD